MSVMPPPASSFQPIGSNDSANTKIIKSPSNIPRYPFAYLLAYLNLITILNGYAVVKSFYYDGFIRNLDQVQIQSYNDILLPLGTAIISGILYLILIKKRYLKGRQIKNGNFTSVLIGMVASLILFFILIIVLFVILFVDSMGEYGCCGA